MKAGSTQIAAVGSGALALLGTPEALGTAPEGGLRKPVEHHRCRIGQLYCTSILPCGGEGLVGSGRR